MKSTKLKKLPQYASDEDAERFVAQSDLSEYDLSGFRPLSVVAEERRAGRPPLGHKAKEHISLRLDRDVIHKFKATGKGWQGRINDALRGFRIAASVAAKPVAAKKPSTVTEKAAAKKPAATATAAAKKPATAKAAKRSPGRSIGSRTASGRK